jgi:hypothetical protein
VFGVHQPVQRCRNHKMRNVVDELPREQHAQVLNVMRAAWKLSDAEEGMKRLEGLARFLEHQYESAARSVREGMAEMFTIQRFETAAVAVQMSGDDQRHREPAERRPEANRERHALAGCRDGRALGCLRVAAHREALPQGDRA